MIGVLAGIGLWMILLSYWPTSVRFFERFNDFKLGLDLRGGTHLVYEADVSDLPADQLDDALGGVRDVIERRINVLGVSEPLVQTNEVGGSQRVIVELAGVHNAGQAIALIGETPQLDFRREVGSQPLQVPGEGEEQSEIQVPVFEKTSLTGKQLKRATVAFDPVSGAPEVSLEFDSEGTELFATLTRENLNKRIAIYLDGAPISAPVVQSEITTGQAVISGGFTVEEARLLAQRLTAGALPVPITLVSQQVVGPVLGRLSIQQSLVAGLVGIVTVMLWMMLFYRLPGLIASIALLLYVIWMLTLIKSVPITLTLAGMAGFIMSVGMAVDANVLVFERLKENLRSGKPFTFSVDDAFREAWAAIRDSNVSTILIAVILYIFGTSLVRGFALTLAVGVVLSMFTAIIVTRTLLRLLLPYQWWRKPWLMGVKSFTPSV